MSSISDIVAAQATFLSDLKDATDSLVSLNNRVYGYTHNAVVVDDLEKDYQTIITATPALGTVSAVGLLAILKDGDTVTTQGNLLYINGVEVTSENGYSFSGTNSENGIEVVKIWYFANDVISLTSAPDYFIIATSLKGISSSSGVNVEYYYVSQLYNYSINLISVREMVRKFYSEITSLPGNYLTKEGNGTHYYLKEAILPELITINQGTSSVQGGFNSCTSLTNIYFPKLINILGSSLNNSYGCPFFQVPNITLPETVMQIGYWSFQNNKNIHLLCKNATNINDGWCQTTPTESFTMCSDWGASINIAIAAANWSLENFIDLLNNKLRDMTLTNETRTLTIPSAKLTALQEDTDGAVALTAAAEKGWTIGGA